jgi:hypothetical protein
MLRIQIWWMEMKKNASTNMYSTSQVCHQNAPATRMQAWIQARERAGQAPVPIIYDVLCEYKYMISLWYSRIYYIIVYVIS